MSSASTFVKYFSLACIGFLLSGCVYTGSEFKAQSNGVPNITGRSRIAGNVLITEATALNQNFCVLGEVDAYAHKFTVFAPVPTREDVDQEMRVKAAAMGADAVIGVRYVSEGTYFPPSELGEVRAIGKAVVVIANNRQCPR